MGGRLCGSRLRVTGYGLLVEGQKAGAMPRLSGPTGEKPLLSVVGGFRMNTKNDRESPPVPLYAAPGEYPRLVESAFDAGQILERGNCLRGDRRKNSVYPRRLDWTGGMDIFGAARKLPIFHGFCGSVWSASAFVREIRDGDIRNYSVLKRGIIPSTYR